MLIVVNNGKMPAVLDNYIPSVMVLYSHVFDTDSDITKNPSVIRNRKHTSTDKRIKRDTRNTTTIHKEGNIQIGNR